MCSEIGLIFYLALPTECHCASPGQPVLDVKPSGSYGQVCKQFRARFKSVVTLAGVVFLGVGLWAWSEKGVLSDLTKVTRLHGIDPVVLVLMVGVVMFTLGFAGCVGALRENICLLKFFCGTIVLIFFLELAVAVLAFLFQDWVRDRFREFFESNIRSYRDDIDLQNLIDSLQKANQCCGAYGPEDWDLNVYFNCSGASYSREKCGVPFSCCVPDPAQKVVNTQCGYDVRTQLKSKWDESIFTKGCIQALEGWLPRNIYIVAGVFIAISLLQVRSPCPLWLPLSLWAVPVRLSQILGLERLWWPGSEQAGSWLPGERVGESRELSASEKPGVPRGAQGLGRDAGSSQVASGAAAAPVWKVHCLENVWL
uniref:Tetraspanin n=1 Tax=Felis catus TaxID=9685 RepID=A0ABI7ZEG2_FELCA